MNFFIILPAVFAVFAFYLFFAILISILFFEIVNYIMSKKYPSYNALGDNEILFGKFLGDRSKYQEYVNGIVDSIFGYDPRFKSQIKSFYPIGTTIASTNFDGYCDKGKDGLPIFRHFRKDRMTSSKTALFIGTLKSIESEEIVIIATYEVWMFWSRNLASFPPPLEGKTLPVTTYAPPLDIEDRRTLRSGKSY